MQAFEVVDVKEFTRRLFMSDTFDNTVAVEAEFLTFVKFSIGGKLNREYFDEECSEEYCTWGSIRHICFEIIKGRRTPTGFKLILKFSKNFSKKWIGENTAKAIDGDLYLNIRYMDSRLHLISSFSPKIFSGDRELEHTFDNYVRDMLKKMNIAAAEAK